MPKVCAKAVLSHGKSLGKPAGLCSLSTDSLIYLTSQVFFVRSFCTANEQVLGSFAQAKSAIFNLLSVGLSPLCTTPAITTNYIKE
jgi:hypothetical protein